MEVGREVDLARIRALLIAVRYRVHGLAETDSLPLIHESHFWPGQILSTGRHFLLSFLQWEHL